MASLYLRSFRVGLGTNPPGTEGGGCFADGLDQRSVLSVAQTNNLAPTLYFLRETMPFLPSETFVEK